MQADAERWGWQFAVASVSDSGVTLLDPDRAQVGREVRLPREAAIDNVLLWLEHRR